MTLEAANNDVEVMIQERMRKNSLFVEQLQGSTVKGDGDCSKTQRQILQLVRVLKSDERLEVS